MKILEPFLAYPEKIEKDDFSDIKWAKSPTQSHFREKTNFSDPYQNWIFHEISVSKQIF